METALEALEALDAAAAAYRPRARMPGAERAAAGQALRSAAAAFEAALTAQVRAEYPNLLQWRVPQPRRLAPRDLWRLAGWGHKALDYARARAAEAYGLEAALAGESNPTLAIRSHTG